MLIGNRIYLKRVDKQDLSYILETENNKAFWDVSNTQKAFSKSEITQFIENQNLGIKENLQERFIIFDFKDQAIGMVDLFEYSAFHRRCSIGVLISNLKFRENGYAKESLNLLIDYAKFDLDLAQLFCHIHCDNLASIHLFEKLNFNAVGTLKKWHYTSEGFKDVKIYQKIL